MSVSGNQSDRSGDGLATDTIFDLLSHQFRRELFCCLQEYDAPLALADAAEELAVATNDASSLSDVDAEVVKRIYLSLYHIHVPKLAEHDVIEYDRERNLISLTDHTVQVDRLLELTSVNDPS